MSDTIAAMPKDLYSLNNYNIEIPKELIAQEPSQPRDSCKLLILDRGNSSIKQSIFSDLGGFLKEGDLLVLNNTKVIKARLIGHKPSGGKVEILLLKEKNRRVWEVLVKPGKNAKLGDTIIFNGSKLMAKVIGITRSASRILEFNLPDLGRFLERSGKVPLPPYIKKELKCSGDYQTIYADKEGAVAAPTAGLHFTGKLIENLKSKGVDFVYITLHCSLATFRPVKCSDIRNHQIESEWVQVPQLAAKKINAAKKNRRRVIAVGTTAIRSLESAASYGKVAPAAVKPFSGETSLYIVPGYKFKVADALITNFHTPCSTNLILVASFCGLDLLVKSYEQAKQGNFRFYSFGDAMLII